MGIPLRTADGLSAVSARSRTPIRALLRPAAGSLQRTSFRPDMLGTTFFGVEVGVFTDITRDARHLDASNIGFRSSSGLSVLRDGSEIDPARVLSHNRPPNVLSAHCHGQRGRLLFMSTISWILARSLVLDRARASILVVPHDLDRP